MQKTQTYCDSCGRAKGETNNWFKLYVYYTHKIFSNCGFPEFAQGEKQPKDLCILDLCGQDCLLTEISKVIS
jgi:predicted Fe-S protein YdhL (DUF1289 family)